MPADQLKRDGRATAGESRRQGDGRAAAHVEGRGEAHQRLGKLYGRELPRLQ